MVFLLWKRSRLVLRSILGHCSCCNKTQMNGELVRDRKGPPTVLLLQKSMESTPVTPCALRCAPVESRPGRRRRTGPALSFRPSRSQGRGGRRGSRHRREVDAGPREGAAQPHPAAVDEEGNCGDDLGII